MQTFSIAVGSYEGFHFRVNPVNSGLVEFHYPDDDGNTVMLQFNRNGGEAAPRVVIPADQAHLVVRNPATGLLSEPVDADQAGRNDSETGAEPAPRPRDPVLTPASARDA